MKIKNFDIQLNNAQYLITVDNKQYTFEINSYSTDTFLCKLYERSEFCKYVDFIEEFVIDSDGGTMDSISEISELILKRAIFPDVYSSLKISEGGDD